MLPCSRTRFPPFARKAVSRSAMLSPCMIRPKSAWQCGIWSGAMTSKTLSRFTSSGA